MHRESTKDYYQRHEDEAERLVRPAPKQKPARHDLRRERVNPEEDPDNSDSSDEKDRSNNYKTIGGSIIDRVVRRAAEERIPAKSRDTGRIVQISPETLKERPGEYEAVDPEDTKEELKEPSELESKKPEQKTQDRTKHYQEAGTALRELAKENPKLDNKLKDFERPESQIFGFLKENPDFPAVKLFPGVTLPPGISTLADMKEALDNALKPSKKPYKKAPAKEAPISKEAPGKSGQPSKEDAPDESSKEEGSEEDPKDKPVIKIPTKAEQAGVPRPGRRQASPEEKRAAISLLVDAFPPNISANLIAKNLHPDDVREFVREYNAAKSAVNYKDIDKAIPKLAEIYQEDPDRVDLPKMGENYAGEKVPFDKLSTPEKAEAALKHQLRVTALSLAAHKVLTNRFSEIGAITGKPRVPAHLASLMATSVLHPPTLEHLEDVSNRVFQATLESGGGEISDSIAEKLLAKAKKFPGAMVVAQSYLQATDYSRAKDTFLQGPKGINEWDDPSKIVKTLKKASEFFEDRNKIYGTSAPHPVSNLFRQRVMERLDTLDPAKARKVKASLPELEEAEYKQQMGSYSKAAKEYLERRKAYREALQEYQKDPEGKEPPAPFAELAPKRPSRPASSFSKSEGEDMWGEVLRPGYNKDIEADFNKDLKEAQKTAESKEFTYPPRRVMASSVKTAVYHGVAPYKDGPTYDGWTQFHQRDFSETDFQAILTEARNWLDSPLLTVGMTGGVEDSKFRAALDLAIYTGPYNGAIPANTYNQLLAKLEGVKEPGRGETLLTKEASYKTDDVYLAVFGSTPVDESILKAITEPKFAFVDETGATVEGGQLDVRLVRQGSVSNHPGFVGESLVRINYPVGSSEVALKTAKTVLGGLNLRSEKVVPSYVPSSRLAFDSSSYAFPQDKASLKNSSNVRKLAAQASNSDPDLALELLAFADRMAEEEKVLPKKDENKEASRRLSSLRSVIIKQASSVNDSQRGPWLPVLQALKDLV